MVTGKKKNDMSGVPICKLIRICYQNGLWKYYKKVCEYNTTLKRIDDIVKRKENVIL